MVIKRIHPNQRLAEAVVHGDTAYLAGQVPQTLGADIETQMREVLTTIDYALAHCDTDKSKLLTATIYLTDLADYDGMNKVWDAWDHGAGTAGQPRLARGNSGDRGPLSAPTPPQ